MIIAPQIKKQYFDSNGNPLVGGKLYTYEAGTTTPLETYTTELGDVPNTNPIILDSRGEVGGLFLASDTYKFVLTDADDVVLWTEDSITVRDFGSEIDAVEADIVDIEAAIAVDEAVNIIKSGKASTKSSRARFLVPVNGADQVKLLATDVDFIYDLDGTEYTVSADLVGANLNSPPVTNNTALVNDPLLVDQLKTKTLGEFNTEIPIDNIGSEISSLEGKTIGIKIAGVSTEYAIAKVDAANTRLIEAKRGWFYDDTNTPINRTAFSDNDVITLMKLVWLYLDDSNVMLASYTEPVYSTTEPTSPLDGDLWYNMTTKKWNRFSSTIFSEIDIVPIGMAVIDENDVCVGARPFDFNAEFSDRDTFDVKYGDSEKIITVDRENDINVFGNALSYRESTVEFDITEDLDTGEVATANIDYYAYIKENGDSVLTEISPVNNLGDLQGYYHPYEAWRYVGKVSTDSSIDFVNGTVRNSPGKENRGVFRSIELGESLTVGDLLQIYNDSGTPKAKKINGVDVLSGKTPVEFSGGNDATGPMSICYDVKNAKVIVVYKDVTDSGYGKAVVGSVNLGIITWGTPVQFNAADTNYIDSCYDEENEKVVIVYSDAGNSDAGTARVGTVSGTTISFGAAEVFKITETIYTAIAYDSYDKKVIVVFSDVNNSGYGTAKIGTVSGTTISFGIDAVFETASCPGMNVCYDSFNKKVVIIYNTTGLNGIVGRVSGTTIIFNSSAVAIQGTVASYISCCFNESENKTVIAYSDTNFLGIGVARSASIEVGAVLDVISFSAKFTFKNDVTAYVSCCYDKLNKKAVISFSDVNNSGYGTGLIVEIKGVYIEFSSEYIFASLNIAGTSSIFCNDGDKIIVVFSDGDNSDVGKGVEIEVDGPKKYSALLLETGVSGEEKDIALNGEITDIYTDQIAGRNAYIQPDGTLSTVSSDYKIGVFLSPTELKLDKNF